MDSRESHSVCVTTPVLLRVLLRSFFIQGSFSGKYRQNLGFAFCMEPVGNCLWSDREDRRKFIERHLEDYNGNPFMCTLVLGTVACLEERLRHGQGSEAEILQYKKALGSATGAVGDRLFWGALRPFALVLGLFTAYFFGIWGALVFFVVYNTPNIALRWYWLRSGYRRGPAVVAELRNPGIERAITATELMGAAILGFMTVVILIIPASGFSWISAASVAFFCGLAVVFRRRAVTS